MSQLLNIVGFVAVWFGLLAIVENNISDKRVAMSLFASFMCVLSLSLVG